MRESIFPMAVEALCAILRDMVLIPFESCIMVSTLSLSTAVESTSCRCRKQLRPLFPSSQKHQNKI